MALDTVEFNMKELGVNGQIITGTTSIVGYYEATLKINREKKEITLASVYNSRKIPPSVETLTAFPEDRIN